MKNLIKWSVPVLAAALVCSANALPVITGGISLAGAPIIVNGPDGNELATATSITSFGNEYVGSVSGTYLANGVPAFPNFQGVDSMGFTFSPSFVPNNPLWSFTYNTLLYSFSLTSITSVSEGTDQNGTMFLNIAGTGDLSITGYESTYASWNLTANSAGSTFSFSSSNGVLAPDGSMTLTLLGGALSGLALIKRKLA